NILVICFTAPRDLPSCPTRRSSDLKHALSAKAKDGGIIVLEKATVKNGKTAALQKNFTKLGLTSALIIDGAELEANFALAARNRSEEHTSELQSRENLVCRLLLEKK